MRERDGEEIMTKVPKKKQENWMKN